MVKARLLIVDDEEDIREILRATLFKYVDEIILAKDGQEAMDILSKEKFDLVLSDVNMPRKTGMELLKWIKETSLLVKVIILSGYGDSTMVRDAKNLGAYEFIHKPWDRKVIVDTVQKAISE